MPHFFAKNLRAVAFPAQSENFKFIFEAKSLRDKSAIIFAESTHSGQKILLSKQEKDGKFLVKFNKHFASHSKEIIKSALKEYADLVGAEIMAHNLNENRVKVDLAYLLGWREICTLLGGNSPLDLHSADFANLGHCADLSLALRPKFAKNHESQTENPSVVDSARYAQNLGENQAKNTESNADSAKSQNLVKIKSKKSLKSFCYFWLLPKVESLPIPLNPNLPSKADLQNLTLDSANQAQIAESANKAQQTIEEIAVEVAEFLGDFGCETGLKSAKYSKSPKSPQDAPKTKLKTRDAFAMLEIGFGSGRHILHLAQTHPNARIFGLEIYRPAISQVLRQIELLNLQNLYLASIDARVLFEVLPARCLDRIFLHFPVPWDKNPQRRVLSKQFLSNAMRVLKDDGIFELLTDSAEYFSFAKALARDYKCVAEEGAEGEVISKYEARWRKQEKVIYRLRVANSASCGDFSRSCSPRFLDEPCVLSASLASHKRENSSTILEFASCVESVDSALDSANSQNLVKNNLARSANPLKSFCYFWLLPKVESPLPLKHNPPSKAESQNLQSGWLLRDARKSYGLPRSHSLARNDEILDSSLRKCYAQNDKLGLNSANPQNLQGGLPREQSSLAMTKNNNFAESALVSPPFSPKKICKKEYFLHIKNKYIFSGGVVVFASFGAYYAPSSAYFVICGDKVSTISEIIPTRANIDAVGLFMELCFDN